jgi:glycosyltransferase involved in cell wall biosynthesis
LARPLVTIVTPSYNQGNFIRKTIESVLAQDYPNIEYIVMDGGSTDHTPAIAAEYAGRLTWVSEKDRGQAHAINKGFQRARGTVVSWLNSDDILLPGAVGRGVGALQRAPHAAAVYGEGYLMDTAGRFTGRFPATEPFNLWKLVYLSDYILQQSVFFRRAAVEAVGWLDEALQYTLDWDLLIRLGKRYGLEYVPEYLGALREYPEAKSFSGGWTRVAEIRRVLERHTGLRRAPGFWTYALDTAQRSWPGVYIPTAAGILLVSRYAQGLYADGWASSRLKWMLPAGSGEVVVRGMVPEERRLANQSLTIAVNRRRFGPWPVGPGKFEIRFVAPEQGGRPLSFEVHAARHKHLIERKAFLLTSANWAGCEQV